MTHPALRRFLALGAAAFLAMCYVGGDALARVTTLEIASKQPYGVFKVGEYQRWDGRIHGELAPIDTGIPDLDKATRLPDGNVAYSARVVLFLPTDPQAGNGALLVDVPNRGNAYANALYDSPRAVPMQSGNFDPGTGFIEDSGFAVAEVYWELGKGADLPSFSGPDGETHFVEGVGFAIVRDAADFLAHAATDLSGTPNPLAGTINRVLGVGKSQDGRFLKTFLLDGFNRVEGRRVFDGLHVFVSGAGLLPIMQSGTGPRSSADMAPSFADPDFPGVNDGPLTIGDVIAKVEARGEIPPKMMLLNSTVDYASLRASLGRTGAKGTADLPLPANVRMYDVAGASHVTVTKAEGCTSLPGRLDWAPVARATLQRLDRWVARNQEPPATRLMPLQPAAADDPTVLRAPKNLPEAVIQVPQRDADGNPLGGVRLPDVAVPLGANATQNAPLTAFTCSLVGAYQPFDKSEVAGETRPSLAERYKDQRDYVNHVRVAARAVEAQGFLLPADAAVIIDSAAATPLFDDKGPKPPPR